MVRIQNEYRMNPIMQESRQDMGNSRDWIYGL